MTGTTASWLALCASIGASIAGQALLKAGASASHFTAQIVDPRSLAGLTAYGVAAVLYMLALRQLPVSVALPLTAVTYLGAALVGYFGFSERLNPLQMAGIAVICAGVAILAVGFDRQG